jgi:hypothetical protein
MKGNFLEMKKKARIQHIDLLMANIFLFFSNITGSN